MNACFVCACQLVEAPAGRVCDLLGGLLVRLALSRPLHAWHVYAAGCRASGASLCLNCLNN